jgi:hypothetical protein
MLGCVDRNALKFHRTALLLGWLFDPMLAHSMPWGRPPQQLSKVFAPLFLKQPHSYSP